APC
ncbi:unnamed protein product, partial [Ophioblennius macclurei]